MSQRGFIVLDYLLVILLIGIALSFGAITPKARPFDPTDPSISLPHSPSTVPTWMLVVLGALFPAVCVVLGGFLTRGSARSRVWEANCALVGIALSISLAMIVTDGLKNAIGRPRPDMLARCKPDPARFNDSYIPGTHLVTIEVCTDKDPGFHGQLRDGFRSFPSGHSSISFAGNAFLSIYIMGKTRLFNEKAYVWKVVLALIPVFLAGWIACSRVTDYRHHPFDVMAGSAIGIAAAIFSYKQWFSFKNGHAHTARWDDDFGTDAETMPLRDDGSEPG